MGRFNGESGAFQGDSGVMHSASVPVHGVSPPDQGVSNRFTVASNGPKWYEFEACVPINQKYKGLRVSGFLALVTGVVVLMCQGEDIRAQIISILACVLYVLAIDPFAAVGSILARASRVILASVLCLIGAAVIIPVPGLITACILWAPAAGAVVKRFNRRYLMQDTFASARAIPDAIRTSPESKAGRAWRGSGAKLVNAMAAELGATCRDYSEVKARELAFYIGYQQADGRTQEMINRCNKLRIENSLIKEEISETDGLRKLLEDQKADNKKRLHDLSISWSRERQQLIDQIKALEAANEELLKAVPEESKLDSVDAKLAHAFNVLHLSDRKAAEFAGTNPTRAYRFRKEHEAHPDTDQAS